MISIHNEIRRLRPSQQQSGYGSSLALLKESRLPCSPLLRDRGGARLLRPPSLRLQAPLRAVLRQHAGWENSSSFSSLLGLSGHAELGCSVHSTRKHRRRASPPTLPTESDEVLEGSSQEVPLPAEDSGVTSMKAEKSHELRCVVFMALYVLAMVLGVRPSVLWCLVSAWFTCSSLTGH